MNTFSNTADKYHDGRGKTGHRFLSQCALSPREVLGSHTFLLYRLRSDDDRTGVGRQQQWQVRWDSIATGHRHGVTTGHTQAHPFLLCVRVWRRWLLLLEWCDVNDRIRVHFCWGHKLCRLYLGGRFGSSSISWRTEECYLANKVHVGGWGVYVVPVLVARAGRPCTHPQCQDSQHSQIITGGCETQVRGVHHGMRSWHLSWAQREEALHGGPQDNTSNKESKNHMERLGRGQKSDHSWGSAVAQPGNSSQFMYHDEMARDIYQTIAGICL